MLKRLLPPQKCRWCKHDLEAGELFCQACRGNRLVPLRWWPVTVASMLVAIGTSCVMGFLIVALWIVEGASAIQAPVVETPLPARTTDQTVLPNPALSVILSDQIPTANQHSTPTPEPTSTPTPEPTSTPTPEPT
ncbi:MAG: hypothetical protein JXA89_06300, partial [Anaerolineae bacterium]|nr:hypothetical protein [Anaerolineae bacterium]